MRSLTTRIMAALITAIILCLSPCFIHHYLSARQELLSGLQSERELTGLQAKKNLALPLYNLDDHQAQQIIESLMINRDVEAIVVRNTFKAGPLTANCRKDGKGGVITVTDPLPASPLRDTHEIYYDNEKLGAVEILYSMDLINHQLTARLWATLAALAITTAVLSSAIFFILRLTLLTPLRQLADFAVSTGMDDGKTAACAPRDMPAELHTIHRALENLLNRRRAPLDATEEPRNGRSGLDRTPLQTRKMEPLQGKADGVPPELHSIVSRIIGFTEIMAQNEPVESGRRGQLLQILDSGRRAEQLIRQLLVPSHESPPQQVAPNLFEESRPANGATIMIVDDEEMIVDMLRLMLGQAGYTTMAFTSSTGALDFFSGNPQAIDMIITDYAMPSMTGLELASKCIELRGDIPIILCTGFADHIDSSIAKEHGVKDFIHKPIDRAYLRSAIGELLSSTRDSA